METGLSKKTEPDASNKMAQMARAFLKMELNVSAFSAENNRT